MSFILTYRLASKRLANIKKWMTFATKAKKGAAASKKTAVCVQDIIERPGETHDDKNARLGRPLSPHLSIYRPQFTSMLSILHRISGTVGSMYLVVFSVLAVHLPYDFCEVAEFIECLCLPYPVILLGRFVLAAPYVYHTCNGVRHLTWDTAHCLGLNEVLYTGIAMMIAVTIVMAIVLFVL